MERPENSPVVALPTRSTGPDGTFGLIRRWQTFLEVEGRTNASTRRQYRGRILQFIADTLIELSDVTEDDVVDYLASLPSQGLSRGMVLRALKSFYRWAADHEIVDRNPVAKLRIKRGKLGPAPSLSTEDLEAMLVAAEGIDPRARPTLELMYATGARIGSLVAVMPSDVKDNRIFFRVAKNDNPYEVPLGTRGRKAADALLALGDLTPKMAGGRRKPTLVGWASRRSATGRRGPGRGQA
jgi:site-specific recombinase XerD